MPEDIMPSQEMPVEAPQEMAKEPLPETQEATQTTETNEVPEMNEIVDALEQALDNLPLELQEALASHLTPETAMIFGAWMGEPVGELMMKYADPETVLVPIPRRDAEKMLGSLPEDTQDLILGKTPQPTEEELS